VHLGLTGADVVDDLSLALWSPKTRSVEKVLNPKLRVRLSNRSGSRDHIRYRALATGTHFVQVRQSSVGLASYRLIVAKRPPPDLRRT
jgi:hypothetical protein